MAGKDKKVKRGRADSSDDGAPQDKKSRLQSFDEARRKEIRETNRLAARECRARKKRLMSELEKTVGNLTAEHSALTKQNRELTIRLETLQRTVGPPPGRIGGMVPGAAGLPGIAGMGQQNMLLGGAGAPQIGLLAGLNASPAFQPDPSTGASAAV